MFLVDELLGKLAQENILDTDTKLSQHASLVSRLGALSSSLKPPPANPKEADKFMPSGQDNSEVLLFMQKLKQETGEMGTFTDTENEGDIFSSGDEENEEVEKAFIFAKLDSTS